MKLISSSIYGPPKEVQTGRGRYYRTSQFSSVLKCALAGFQKSRFVRFLLAGLLIPCTGLSQWALNPPAKTSPHNSAILIASLSHETPYDVSIDLKAGLYGSAKLGSDFVLSREKLIIKGHNRIGTALISGVNDQVVDEGDETVIFNIKSSHITHGNAVDGHQSATIIIEDKDDSQGVATLTVDGRYAPSVPVEAKIEIRPTDMVETYWVLLPLPDGWTADQISHQGSIAADSIVWDALAGSNDLSFRLIADNQTRGTKILTATVVAESGDFKDEEYIFDIKGSFEVTSRELIVSEKPTADVFTVVLTEAPIAPVVVEFISTHPDEVSLSQNIHFFTSKNFDIPVQVAVTGIRDDKEDSDQSVTISLSKAQSVDPYFSGAQLDDVKVKVLDVSPDELKFAGGPGPENSEPFPHPADLNADGYLSAQENHSFMFQLRVTQAKHPTYTMPLLSFKRVGITRSIMDCRNQISGSHGTQICHPAIIGIQGILVITFLQTWRPPLYLMKESTNLEYIIRTKMEHTGY